MEFSSDTGASGFALEPAAEGGVQGELWGALEAGVLAQLQASLRALDTAGHSRRRLLLLRLGRVTQCGPGARARWVALHRLLSQERWRTAYLDPRPWGRGQALAVVHRAGDALALAVGQEPRALAWLAARSTRLEAAQALVAAEPAGAAETAGAAQPPGAAARQDGGRGPGAAQVPGGAQGRGAAQGSREAQAPGALES